MILNENESYLLGFLQTDGHRNKNNCYQLELSYKDIDILNKIKKYFNIKNPIKIRERITNFSNNKMYKFVSLYIPGIKIENLNCFIPFGKKSEIISAPKNITYSEVDYWRGVIDGDGSVGIRNAGPYISLNTSSDELYHDFNSFLMNFVGIKTNNKRNKRDNTYNVVICSTNAITLANLIYDNKCKLFLIRKKKLANKIKKCKLKTYKKLTKANVLFIRKNKNNYTRKGLSKLFKVSKTAINDVILNYTWKNI